MTATIFDYEKLVADFNDRLLTQLRSFGADSDFLDSWVPDEDPVMSILNMVEAAELSGRTSFVVRVKETMVPEQEIERLARQVGALATVRTSPADGDLLIHVSEIGSRS